MKWRIAKWIFLALFIAYFAGSFVFLNFFVEKMIVSSTDEIVLKYDFAYSVWPGRVIAKNFSFRLQDSNVQMYFEFPSVRVNLSPFKLFKRELHASSVDAGEMRFFFRFRRDSKDAKTVSMKAIPPIPGLESIEKTPSLPSTDPFNPWKIELESIDIDKVTELWLEEFRFRGSMGLAGGFYLFPKALVEIYPTEININDGTVTVEDQPLSKKILGSINASIARFDPEKVSGMTLFKHISSRLKLKANVTSLGFINYYLRNSPNVRLGGGGGDSELDITVKDGEFVTTSSLNLVTSDLAILLHDQTAVGKGRIQWSFTEENANRLALELAPFKILPKAHGRYWIEGDKCAVELRSTQRNIHEPVTELDWGLEIADATINDLRYGNLYLPNDSALRFLKGKAAITANVKANAFTAGKDEGNVEVNANGARFKVGSAEYLGDLKAAGKFHKSHISKGTLWFPDVTVQASHVSLQGKRDSRFQNDWSMNAKAKNSLLRLGDSPEIKSRLQFQASDGRPFLYLLSNDGKNLPDWITKIFPLSTLKASAYLWAKDGFLGLTDVTIDSENAAVHGWLENSDQDGLNTRLLIKAEPVAVGYEAVNGKGSLRLHEAEKWFDKKELQKKYVDEYPG